MPQCCGSVTRGAAESEARVAIEGVHAIVLCNHINDVVRLPIWKASRQFIQRRGTHKEGRTVDLPIQFLIEHRRELCCVTDERRGQLRLLGVQTRMLWVHLPHRNVLRVCVYCDKAK